MKFLCKILVMLLLLSYACPFVSSMAIDCASNENEALVKNVDESTEMVKELQEDKCYDLPHRDVFINTITSYDSAELSRGQRTIEVWDNGFSYEDGYSVNTRGQVSVAAVKAVTDYDSFEGRMEQELAIMRQEYPGAFILADPTSKYNCHSYAWCETEEMSVRWIPNAELFLRDIHTFKPVAKTEAQEGDIVLYTNTLGLLAHSAVIVQVDGSTIRCISKWGASVLCEHELEYVPNTYKNNGECEILIVRRTEHTGPIQPSSAGQHTLSCTICSHDFASNCEFTVTNNGNGTHARVCSLCTNHDTVNCSLEYTNSTNTRHSVSCTECGYYVNSQLCTLTYTSKGNKTHTARCSQCNNSYTGNCSITYSYTSANQHRGSCSKCSYTHTASCYYMTAYCGNSTLGDVHRTQCQTCGHVSGSATTACTFAYKGVGENKHVYRCTECLYIKSGPTACMFKSDNTCKFCGTRKDAAVLNGVEEDHTH